MTLICFLFLLASVHADQIISFVGYAKVNAQFNNTFSLVTGMAFQVQIVSLGQDAEDWKNNVVLVAQDGSKTLIQATMRLNYTSNTVSQEPDTAGRISQEGSVLQITYAGLQDGPPLAGIDRYDLGKTYTAWTTVKRGPMQVESLWYLNSIPNIAFTGFAAGASIVPVQGGVHNTMLGILQKIHGKF
jgi:hypothetical protein